MSWKNFKISQSSCTWDCGTCRSCTN